MSLKPLKHSEKKKLPEKYNMKQRREAIRTIKPQYYLIVCEGKKTEPNYFEGLKNKINERFSNRIDVKNIVDIEIKGEGTNTIFLLQRAKQYVENNPNHYSHVWLVYDQDDFPKDNFDNTEYSAIAMCNDTTKYHVAWSNQCIELWFLLHFIYFDSDIHRDNYLSKLKEFFDYEKNLPNIFKTLCEKGNLMEAIRRAQHLYNKYENNVPSKMTPATRVHELVIDLLQYLHD